MTKILVTLPLYCYTVLRSRSRLQKKIPGAGAALKQDSSETLVVGVHGGSL